MLNLNERRTRRGVYAISKPTSESSDESEDGEDDNTKPLADAVDTPADGEIELTATGANSNSLTPSLHLSNGTNSTGRNSATPFSIDSPSSLAEVVPSSTGPSATSNSFRSVISTRSQKARGVSNASAVMGSSRSVSADIPGRLTRSVSQLQLPEGKGKASPSPSVRSLAAKQIKGVGKDDRMGKNEADSRVARTRPDAVKEKPKFTEVPRGPDGKPFPTCATCSNVLPLITINFKVVWGQEHGTKRNKNSKQNCPRYVMHRLYPSKLTSNDSIVVYVTLRSMKCRGHAASHRQDHCPLLEKNQPLRMLTRRM